MQPVSVDLSSIRVAEILLKKTEAKAISQTNGSIGDALISARHLPWVRSLPTDLLS